MILGNGSMHWARKTIPFEAEVNRHLSRFAVQEWAFRISYVCSLLTTIEKRVKEALEHKNGMN